MNLNKGNKNHMRLAIVVMLAIVVIVTLRTCAIYPAQNHGFNTDECTTLDTGWIAIEDGQERTVNIYKPQECVEGTFKMYRHFSAEEVDRGYMMIMSNRQNMTITSRGRILEEVRPADDKVKSSVNAYCIVRLPQTGEGAIINITYSNCRDNVCNINDIYIASADEVFSEIVRLDAFGVFVCLSMLLLILGLVIFAILLKTKGSYKPRVFWLIFLSLAIVVWIISNMWCMSLLPFSEHLVCYISYTALMCMPIPIAMYGHCSCRKQLSVALHWLAAMALLNVIVQQILYVFNIASLFDMLPVTHILLYMAIIITFMAIYKDYKAAPTDSGRLLLVTYAWPIIFSFMAILLFWIYNYAVYSIVFEGGMFIFIIMLVASALSSLISEIIRVRETEAELDIYHKLSVVDAMTELGNRRAFDLHMDQIESKELKQAILFFMDVNGLKNVNDLYGHDSGDSMIMSAAKSIRQFFGEMGKCYRLGGDEFAVIIENPEKEAEVYIEEFNRVISISNVDETIEVSIAIGYEMLISKDGIRRSTSLWKSRADKEMYANKMRAKLLAGIDSSDGIISDNIDPFMGILNIEGFRKNAAYCIYQNPDEKYALWYYNIKNFKFVNDFFGYEMGDNLIKYWGKIILESIGEGETCGRISGDTVAILTKFRSDEQLHSAFDDMANTIGSFCEKPGFRYYIEMVAGVYKLNPEDMRSPDINQMLDWATVASKNVYNQSGSALSIFGEEMWEKAWRSLYINQTLDEAIENGDIQVWFQPQYDFETGQVVAAEALCRWVHSELGWLSPSEFIETLESSGQIARLDAYVWDKTCQLAKKWQESPRFSTIPVSVNISRLDVREGYLYKQLNSITDRYNLSRDLFRLEITESAYLNRPEMLIDAVNKLHREGYVVEMDDFGKGYSALNMLKDVPIDYIKLDMGFIEGDSDNDRGNSILASVINMADALEIPTICEGVETKEQAELLAKLGCTCMQGYYFSKPLPVENFEELISIRAGE